MEATTADSGSSFDVSNKSECLQGDVLSRILSYLSWREVIRCRAVASSWREAASRTPVTELAIDSPVLKERLDQIAHCIPHLQSLLIDQKSEICDESFASVARFRHLKKLTCRDTILLQHSFSHILQLRHLQKLNLHGNENLQWKLSDLAPAFPQLQDLRCINNRCVTGDLKDLLQLSQANSLQVVDVSGCPHVTGNFIDLAKLPKLKWYGISRTKIQGDLRDIQPGDFPSLQLTGLDPHKIYGASEFLRVSHASAIMKARHQLVQQSTDEIPIFPFLLRLSADSPDYHERIEQRLYTSELDPPFNIENNLVVGTRRGWRWSNYLGGCCQVHWLDPEPDNQEEHAKYLDELAKMEEEDYSPSNIFRGFLEPPTPDEYKRLCLERAMNR